MDSSYSDNTVTILYLNIYGQTKFYDHKQFQLQEMVQKYNCDIVHLQEVYISDDTLSNCHFIRNNFQVISNNSTSGYGTASLVRNDMKVENISIDTRGRLIIFDINNITYCNVYLDAGTDNDSRTSRENYLGETIPNLLINHCDAGYAGGDWNCIIEKRMLLITPAPRCLLA